MRAIFKAFQLGFIVSLTSVILLFLATETFAKPQQSDIGSQVVKIK